MSSKDEWKKDKEAKSFTITGVQGNAEDGWSIQFDDSSWLGLPETKIVPEVGQSVVAFGSGWGSVCRGIVIEGKVVYYRTVKQQAERQKRDAAKIEYDQIETYKRERPTLNAAYDNLPKCFQRRLNKFRRNNPNFRWKYESYEMFCCLQAILIADTLGNSTEIIRYSQSEIEVQKELVPDVDYGQHSGNTFSCACQLAIHFLENQQAVIDSYGALAPLVGSEEYGCIPRGKAVPNGV